jgi:hypothetical protein
MRFSREKRTFDPNSVRFGHSDRKVPATYFPLFEIDREKTRRKTALCFGKVESTFLSKKTKQWKVQNSQKQGAIHPRVMRAWKVLARNPRVGPIESATPTVLIASYPLLFTIRNSLFIPCLPPMAIFCPKICALVFSGVETSMKMTFHSPGKNQRAARRRRGALSNPTLYFSTMKMHLAKIEKPFLYTRILNG